MRKFLALLFLVLATPAFADFTIILDAGRLTLNSTTAMPIGSVLVLVAAGGDGSFSNSLSAGQYVSGNDILLSVLTPPAAPASAAPFNNEGGAQETFNTIVINTTNFPALGVGDLLALRWFPQITFTQFEAGTTPVAGNNFGTYNPFFYGNATNNPDDGNVWAVPSGGSTINLNFFTTDAIPAGSQNPTEGFAQFTVVPEPTTWALLITGLVGAAVVSRSRRRA